MRFRRFPIYSFILLLIIAVVGVAIAVIHTAFATLPLAPVQNHPAVLYTDGMPAIAVSPATMLTTADVQQYVTSHSFPGGPTVSGAAPQVVTIQQVTSAQASSLLKGESIGLPGNAPVYYVVLRGPFVMASMHVPAGVNPPTANQVVEVFDAQTGNLLVWGTD